MSGTGTGRRGRMPAWYRALPEIDANPAGLSGDEPSRRLAHPGANGDRGVVPARQEDPQAARLP